MQENVWIRLPRSLACDIISADDVALKVVKEFFEILRLAIKVPSRGSSGDYDRYVVFHQVLDQPLYSREELHGWPLRILLLLGFYEVLVDRDLDAGETREQVRRRFNSYCDLVCVE
jgi:hypothetical protein